MGEALEEALVRGDECQGLAEPSQRIGFHVETPAEKTLELLDKIMHGVNVSDRSGMRVSDHHVQNMPAVFHTNTACNT